LQGKKREISTTVFYTDLKNLKFAIGPH